MTRVQKIKRHIQSTFPHSKSVEIKVRKTAGQKFKTMIKVLAPERRALIAEKVDDNVNKSLKAAHQAILSQARKVKTRWEAKPKEIQKLKLS